MSIETKWEGKNILHSRDQAVALHCATKQEGQCWQASLAYTEIGENGQNQCFTAFYKSGLLEAIR